MSAFIGNLAGLVAIAAPFVMIILIVWWNISKKRHENQIKADLYSQAIEKGQALPENFFADQKPKRNALRNGIICMAVGVGLGMFFLTVALTVADEAWGGIGISLIPFCIGLGFLLIHFLQEKSQNDTENQ